MKVKIKTETEIEVPTPSYWHTEGVTLKFYTAILDEQTFCNICTGPDDFTIIRYGDPKDWKSMISDAMNMKRIDEETFYNKWNGLLQSLSLEPKLDEGDSRKEYWRSPEEDLKKERGF